MKIPPYLLFPDKDSERSKTHSYLLNHQTNKLTIENVEALSKRNELEKKKIEDDEILNALGLYEKKEVSEPEKWDFNFRMYMHNTYPKLKKDEKDILIESSIDKLRLFLKIFAEIIRHEVYEKNSEGTRIPNKQKLKKYHRIRKDVEIKSFFKAIELNLIPFGKSILHEDLNLQVEKFGIFHYYDRYYIANLLSFCILQYEEIIRNTLDQINIDENQVTKRPKYIEDMIDDCILKPDGKTIIADLEELLSFFKQRDMKITSQFIHETFIQGNGRFKGKPWAIRTIEQKISDFKA